MCVTRTTCRTCHVLRIYLLPQVASLSGRVAVPLWHPAVPALWWRATFAPDCSATSTTGKGQTAGAADRTKGAGAKGVVQWSFQRPICQVRQRWFNSPSGNWFFPVPSAMLGNAGPIPLNFSNFLAFRHPLPVIFDFVGTPKWRSRIAWAPFGLAGSGPSKCCVLARNVLLGLAHCQHQVRKDSGF